MTKILIKRLDPTVPLPSYAKAGDAGADEARAPRPGAQ